MSLTHLFISTHELKLPSKQFQSVSNLYMNLSDQLIEVMGSRARSRTKGCHDNCYRVSTAYSVAPQTTTVSHQRKNI